MFNCWRACTGCEYRKLATCAQLDALILAGCLTSCCLDRGLHSRSPSPAHKAPAISIQGPPGHAYRDGWGRGIVANVVAVTLRCWGRCSAVPEPFSGQAAVAVNQATGKAVACACTCMPVRSDRRRAAGNCGRRWIPEWRWEQTLQVQSALGVGRGEALRRRSGHVRSAVGWACGEYDGHNTACGSVATKTIGGVEVGRVHSRSKVHVVSRWSDGWAEQGSLSHMTRLQSGWWRLADRPVVSPGAKAAEPEATSHSTH